MATSSSSKSSKQKVQEHRRKLRAQGLRPIQIWVPDVCAAAFKSEAHRQAHLVASSSQADDDQTFIDAVSELNERAPVETSNAG